MGISGFPDSFGKIFLSLLNSPKCARIWRGFAEGVLPVALFTVLYIKWSVKNTLCKGFTGDLRAVYMKIIVSTIPINLLQIPFYIFFVLSRKPKTRIKFDVDDLVTRNISIFLFMASRTLLQKYTEFNRLL